MFATKSNNVVNNVSGIAPALGLVLFITPGALMLIYGPRKYEDVINVANVVGGTYYRYGSRRIVVPDFREPLPEFVSIYGDTQKAFAPKKNVRGAFLVESKKKSFNKKLIPNVRMYLYRDPIADWAGISKLLQRLKAAKLIST